jgi:N-methylhydantoinase A
VAESSASFAAEGSLARLEDVDLGYLNRIFADMEAQAVEVIRGSAVAGEVTLLRSADVRYLGQGFELTVPLALGGIGPAELSRLRQGFDEAYAARYGYANPKEPVEIVNWKLTALGAGPKVALPKYAPKPRLTASKPSRPVYFPERGGYIDCPVYDRYHLAPGSELAGPAVIEERESTTVLPPGCVARVDDYATLLVKVEPSR